MEDVKSGRRQVRLERLETAVYEVPTSLPEGDGTAAWEATTMVLVEAVADSGERGLGYTYGSMAAASLVHEKLASLCEGRQVDEVGAAWEAMVRAVRNLGRPGIAATAISAVDIALWDLRARAHGLALHRLLGTRRDAVPIYGSGGFTTYCDEELAEQLAGWVRQGVPRVKMKLGVDRGAHEDLDLHRVRVAREAIGPDTELFVDANGAYGAKQAVRMGRRFAEEAGVVYFEEPVSSDQLENLALVRRSIPEDVAAGEYGYDPWYFRRMLEAEAVDVLQADVTRCLGITGWMEAASLAHAFGVPFSAHCGPSLHAHVGCAAPQIAHIEYFWDHVRIEAMLFEGVLTPEPGGLLRPDRDRPGLGLELKRSDARRFQVAA